MNARQIAIVGWTFVAFVVALSQPALRRNIADIIRSFANPAMIVMGISSAAWNVAVVWVLWRAGVWSAALWFDTLSFVAIGTLSLMLRFQNGFDYGWQTFARVAATSFGLSVLLEAFVYNYTFSLPVEIVLVPWLVFWGLIQAYAQSDSVYAQVHRVASGILLLSGGAMVLRSIMGALEDSSLFSLSTMYWLLLPFVLTACYLPYLALLRVWMAYEQACTPFTSGTPKRAGLKLYVVLRYVLRFGFNLTALSDFRRERYSELQNATSREAVDALF